MSAARRQSRRARQDRPRVYGDAAYGSGEFLDHLARAGIDNRCKTQPPAAPGGRYSKAHFYIDLDADTVTCPAGEEVTIRRNKSGDGIAYFESACAACPLRSDCTTAAQGRTIQVGRHEALLAEARTQANDPKWRDDYRQTRPKVERKLAHLMRRRHGGRRARVRGRKKVRRRLQPARRRPQPRPPRRRRHPRRPRGHLGNPMNTQNHQTKATLCRTGPASGLPITAPAHHRFNSKQNSWNPDV